MNDPTKIAVIQDYISQALGFDKFDPEDLNTQTSPIQWSGSSTQTLNIGGIARPYSILLNPNDPLYKDAEISYDGTNVILSSNLQILNQLTVNQDTSYGLS